MEIVRRKKYLLAPMRLAYFSPLNPESSGISDYSEELLPALSKYAEIDLFVNGFVPSNRSVRDCFAIYKVEDFAQRQAVHPYITNVYQMGNHPGNRWIHRMLMRYPGVVVLHDVVLHHFFLETSRIEGDSALYLRELAYEAGTDWIALGVSILRGERPAPLFEYPLASRVTDASLGVIVHNQFARSLLRTEETDRVAVIPAHMSLPPQVTFDVSRFTRQELNIAPDAMVVGTFGHVTPAKRTDVLLRVFKKLLSAVPRSHLLIVGPVDEPAWLNSSLADLNLRNFVTVTGPVPMDRFRRYIQVSDICVNLRYPPAGETSASLLRIMAQGRPVVVSDAGSFSELPNDACLKIAVGDSEEHELLTSILTLANDEKLRQGLGEAARSLVSRCHSPDSTARSYIEFIEQIVTRRANTRLGEENMHNLRDGIDSDFSAPSRSTY